MSIWSLQNLNLLPHIILLTKHFIFMFITFQFYAFLLKWHLIYHCRVVFKTKLTSLILHENRSSWGTGKLPNQKFGFGVAGLSNHTKNMYHDRAEKATQLLLNNAIIPNHGRIMILLEEAMVDYMIANKTVISNKVKNAQHDKTKWHTSTNWSS